MKKRFISLLLISLLLACFNQVLSAKTVEMPVYQSWRGNNSEYKSARPFFLIKDIHDLERFWNKANLGEAMPNIDFSRLMLFVWNPGSSLFDHRPVEVERLLSKDSGYLVLMNFNRKNTGGYWRNPVVVTMLPLIEKGDIHIMTKEFKNSSQFEWRPLYTLWDMNSQRKRPFEVVALDKPVKSQEFITHSQGESGSERTQVALAPKPQPASQIQTQTRAQTQAQTQTQTQRSNAVVSGTPVSSPASAPAGQSQAKSAESFDDLFGTSKKEPAAKPIAPVSPQPKKVESKVPGFEEDPLFGSEFDITF